MDRGYVDLGAMVSHPINLVYDPADPDVWTLAQDYTRETSLGTVTVPAGFVTDLASVPNQVWHAFPKFGKWTGAAVIHDFLYRTQPDGISRDSSRPSVQGFVEIGRRTLWHGAVISIGWSKNSAAERGMGTTAKWRTCDGAADLPRK